MIAANSSIRITDHRSYDTSIITVTYRSKFYPESHQVLEAQQV
jgi:hypothetical protein